MSHSFAEELSRYTQAISHIGRRELAEIRRTIEVYIKRFGINRIDYYCHLVEDEVEFLVPSHELSTEGPYWRLTVRTMEGQPNGFCATSFLRRAPLWLVPASNAHRNLYAAGAQFINLFPDSVDKITPPKGYASTETVRMEVDYPVVSEPAAKMGVACFRTDEKVVYSNEVSNELRLFSRCLARLKMKVDNLETDRDYASQHIGDLVRRRFSDRKTLPVDDTIYLIYPERGDRKIIGLIEEVIREIPSLAGLRIVKWERQTGQDIMSDVTRSILRCRILVAFLSEIGEQDQYFDNHNVLFELGLWAGSRAAQEQGIESMIIVRDSGSPELCYDLSRFRLLIAERHANGELLEISLKTKLRERLIDIARKFGDSTLN